MIQKMKLGESKVVLPVTEDSDQVSAWVTATATATVETFRPGQQWGGPKGKFNVVRKWDKLFVVRDKYGDERKYSKEGLKALIQQLNLKLVADKKWQEALNKAILILSPFLGMKTFFLARLLQGFLSKAITGSLNQETALTAAPAEYIDQETGWSVQEGEKITVKNMNGEEEVFYVFQKSPISGMLLISKESPELYPPPKPVKDLKMDLNIFGK